MSAKLIDSEKSLRKKIQTQGIAFVVFNTAILMLLFVLIPLYLGYSFYREQVVEMIVFSYGLVNSSFKPA